MVMGTRGGSRSFRSGSIYACQDEAEGHTTMHQHGSQHEAVTYIGGARARMGRPHTLTGSGFGVSLSAASAGGPALLKLPP